MKIRKLHDLKVSAIGYGCMGLSHGYGPVPEANECCRLIRKAFENGCTFFDTAESYGAGDNEEKVGNALAPIRKEVIVATKFHLPQAEVPTDLNKEITSHLDASLKRLQMDYIDLYYLHRINPAVPVEEIAVVMGKLIKSGKIRGWGMSQCTADEIQRANRITELTAVQSEYSIMERMFEKGVIPLCQKLNIGFVPFSPLAAGFLSGKYKPGYQYIGDDVRRVITRFSEKNILANQHLLETLQNLALKKEVTTAQISLAWMLHKYNFVVPIPGSRTDERIIENLGAVNVELSPEEFTELETQLAKITIFGNRTDEDIAKLYKDTILQETLSESNC